MQRVESLVHGFGTAAITKQLDDSANPVIKAMDYVRDLENNPNLFDRFRTYRLVNAEEHEAILKRGNVHPEASLPSMNIRISADTGIAKNKIVLTFGCQGTKSSDQNKVADYLEKVVQKLGQEFEITCVLILGDNVYSSGASSPTDSKIKECTSHIYADEKKHPALSKIPFFYIHGNHDQNFHSLNIITPFKKRVVISPCGADVGNNQTAATYLNPINYENFNQRNPEDLREYLVNTKKLSHFNMPGRAYSLIIGDVEYFCIDSNNYVKDYYDWKVNGKLGTQAQWLEERMAISASKGLKPVLALHHPPLTLGSRAFGHDRKYYFEEDDLPKVKNFLEHELDPEDTSYNSFIKATLKKQGLTFDAIFAAHDHSMYYYHDGQTAEIVSAGGGGSLQERFHFKDSENVATFQDDFGFVAVESVRDKLYFAIYSMDDLLTDYPLLYTNKDKMPIRLFYHLEENEKKHVEKYCLTGEEAKRHFTHPLSFDEEQKVKNLLNAARQAVDNFMHFMAEQQIKHGPKFCKRNFTHTYEEIERGHRLITYLSRPHVSSFDVTLYNILQVAEYNSQDSVHSLSHYLFLAYQARFSHQNLVKDYLEAKNRLFPPKEPSRENCVVM